jgi:ABC-type multidrug transport system permease subunit
LFCFCFWGGFLFVFLFVWIFFLFSGVCLFVCLVLVFRDRVSLCSPGCPGTHFVDQAFLELRNLPASASQVLGLKACATTTWLLDSFYFKIAFFLPGKKCLVVQL